jgi:hypothetical protein
VILNVTREPRFGHLSLLISLGAFCSTNSLAFPSTSR